jgi:tetratricopeptide (TPR) repeat protein
MKLSSFLTLTALFLLNITSQAQTDTTGTGIFGQTSNAVKIVAAKHEFNENNMRGALTIYREVLDTDPTNATAHYGIAECHYNLKKYNLALEYLNKAVGLNAEVTTTTDFFYGQIYHRVADLDKAINYFQKYIDKTRGNTYEKELAVKYVKECNFAKVMMAKPVDVKVQNMGEAINTRFEEYTPCITADGKFLVFTSRRSDTKGGEIDKKGDYKFFEDIYYSTYDDAAGKWSDSEPLPGDVNTNTYDAVLSVFPDGSGVYVYKNTVTTTGEIFFSKRSVSENKWYAAERMPRPINTSYFESSVSMTADGNTLYFISERPEGLGQGDIYVSYKKGDKWSNPKNLGKVINTEDDEKFVFIHPNGKTLYFASNGHECLGSYDIFKTELVNGEWSIPVNLGYPINTVNEESTFSLTSDNTKMLMAAEYSDSYGERDIYMIDVSSYELVSKGYDTGTFGQIICIAKSNATGKVIKGIKVNIFDEAGKLISSGETDKAGRFKASLQGNKSYRVEFVDGEKIETREVTLTMKTTGETIEKVEVGL